MLNILSHKGNANQNNTEISSHPNLNGNHQENKKQMLVRMQREKEPIYTVVREIN
jgi:hypothetical protein